MKTTNETTTRRTFSKKQIEIVEELRTHTNITAVEAFLLSDGNMQAKTLPLDVNAHCVVIEVGPRGGVKFQHGGLPAYGWKGAIEISVDRDLDIDDTLFVRPTN